MTKTLAVLFGGQSSEHDISCMSAANIADCIDTSRYELYLIGITREGRWLLVDSTDDIRSGDWTSSKTGAILSPDAKHSCIIISEDASYTRVSVDIVFPVLHGRLGEDGTVQGLCELAQIPYVGCGVFASAASMDKLYTKIVVDVAGIKQAQYISALSHEWQDKKDDIVSRIERELSYPVFVKPSRAGSSCGITRAEDRKHLLEGIEEAFRFDTKALIEKQIVGREVECAVYSTGNDEPMASGVGEIIADGKFYDFDAKYHSPESKTLVEPDIPSEIVADIQKKAIEIYKALDCYGMSRVDFFLEEDGQVVFNEINTIPGFTAISMYPMLWEARGIEKKALVEKLIESAMARSLL